MTDPDNIASSDRVALLVEALLVVIKQKPYWQDEVVLALVTLLGMSLASSFDGIDAVEKAIIAVRSAYHTALNEYAALAKANDPQAAP